MSRAFQSMPDEFHSRLTAAMRGLTRPMAAAGLRETPGDSCSTGGSAAADSRAAPSVTSGADDFSVRLRQLLDETHTSDDREQTGEANEAADSDRSSTSDVDEADEESQADAAGPAGTGDHVVRQGECISSIAHETGCFWETIWNDSANDELREARQNPNVLLPDDRVTIPEKQRKDETIAAEMRHRFRRRGEPTMFRLRLLEHDEPIANQPYVAEIEGREQTGETDADGNVRFSVPANATAGRLRVGGDNNQREYRLAFRRLEPVTSVTGAQQRLSNLGFGCGAADGELGPRTRGALRRFQAQHGLDPTGALDQDTRERLKEEHGS